MCNKGNEHLWSCIKNNNQVKAKGIYFYNYMLHVNMGPRVKKTLPILSKKGYENSRSCIEKNKQIKPNHMLNSGPRKNIHFTILS